MISANRLLTDAQVHRVNDAVAATAAKTSAHIVPVVAACSDAYSRAEELVGWWAAALGLTLTGLLVTQRHLAGPAGEQASASTLKLGAVLAAVVVGSAIGAFMATRIGWLRRMFISRKAMLAAAQRRAHRVLRDCRMKAGVEADTRPIVLIFISLYERSVTVVAGSELQGHLSSVAVEQVRMAIVKGLAGGQACEAICQAVDMAAELLSSPCPPTAGMASPAAAGLQVID